MKSFLKSLIFLLAVSIVLILLIFILASFVPPSQIISLPWYITRASALTAFGLMFLVVLLGIGMTVSFIYDLINPVRAWIIHKYLALSLIVMIGLHVSSLLFDNFISLRLADILIPFHSAYQPLFLALGILGFYIILATILISIFLRLRTPRFWRWTHYWVYPLFGLSLLHGLFIGTDSSTPLMQFIYWTAGIIFVILLGYRFTVYHAKIKLQ